MSSGIQYDSRGNQFYPPIPVPPGGWQTLWDGTQTPEQAKAYQQSIKGYSEQGGGGLEVGDDGKLRINWAHARQSEDDAYDDGWVKGFSDSIKHPLDSFREWWAGGYDPSGSGPKLGDLLLYGAILVGVVMVYKVTR